MKFKFKTIDLPPEDIAVQLEFAARAVRNLRPEDRKSHSMINDKKLAVQWEFKP